jgi:hypothetical protein
MLEKIKIDLNNIINTLNQEGIIDNNVIATMNNSIPVDANYTALQKTSTLCKFRSCHRTVTNMIY